MKRCERYSPPRWVIDTGAMVYNGIIALYVITILYGVGLVLFGKGCASG